MTRTIDFAVIDNLRASASQGQHAHVIQETFAIGYELQKLQLHVLDMRARSYVACAQFDSALGTANTMQQLNPASPLGYLCQGYINLQQGRYLAACDVYDKALQHVDKRDSLYDIIQTAKEEAMQQGRKRRDFICDFPMEISARIIQHVLIKEEYDQQREYIMVSSAWWHRIMATNELEYTIRGTLPLEESNAAVIQSFNHTRSLTLRLCKPPLAHLFQKYRFTCLTTLSIYASIVGAFAESIKALEWIGTQLTDLTLVYRPDCIIHQQQECRARLQYILRMCPNLESLHCEATIDISDIEHIYPKLHDLKLYRVRGTVDRQHMMMIRQRLPGLKTLNMAIAGSSRPLTVDDTFLLPCIRHLGYGERPSTNHQKLDIKHTKEQGLVSFSINDAKPPFPLDDIAPVLIEHHETLQFLEFVPILGTATTRRMTDATRKNRHIQFRQLQALHTYTLFTPSEINTMLPFCNFINWIIERAPYLHTVALKGYTMNRSSLNTLAKCIHLRHVDFQVQDSQRPDDYDTLVAEFLRDHVDYMADKGGSQLDSFNVHLYQAHPLLINAIRELKWLTSFRLIASDLESEPFTQLFKSLRQGCQGMRTLLIKTPGAIPNPILYQVGGCSNLRMLTMVGDLQHSQAGVLSLQRCRHLERIIDYRPVDNEIRTMLLESNPRLQITYTHTPIAR